MSLPLSYLLWHQLSLDLGCQRITSLMFYLIAFLGSSSSLLTGHQLTVLQGENKTLSYTGRGLNLIPF